MQFNPANFLALALVGAALLWTVRLVYGARRGPSDDWVKRALLLAGWIMLVSGAVVGTVGLSGILSLLPAVGLLFAGMVYFKYMAAERRALLWALAVAAEKGIPLEQAARAFADERSVQIGLPVSRLADLLESGVPLPAALTMSRNRLPADALLAARLGLESFRLDESLQMSLVYGEQFEAMLRDVAAKFFYLIGFVLVGMLIVTFTMLKIVPVFIWMFQDFGLALPAVTESLVSASTFFVEYWWAVIPPIAALMMILLAAGATFDLGSSRYEIPVFQRIWLRCDSALVMRALGLSVRQQQDLNAAVSRLSREYPRASIGRRLLKASQRIEQGHSWTEALHRVGLIRGADRAVLESAQRVGNLGWALDEMADSTLRRFTYRLRAALQIVFPLVILIFGALVLWFVTALFLPLVSMIQGLS
jgi:type II secretory pathway component PulF